MQINKKKPLNFSFSDGHPRSYHVVAVMLAMFAVSIAITAQIFAQSTTTTPGTVDSISYPNTLPAGGVLTCSYSYSIWSTCQPDNKQYRKATATPSGCTSTTTPIVTQSCNYVAPITTTPLPVTTTPITTTNTSSTTTISPNISPCVYNYTAFGTCQSDGKVYRTVIGTSPSVCSRTTSPVLTETCKYTAPVTTNTAPVTTATTPAPLPATVVQCVYSYSGWGACQSNGKQTQRLLSQSPTNCTPYTQPILERSCVYDTVVSTPPLTTNNTTGVSTTTSTSTSAGTTTVTGVKTTTTTTTAAPTQVPMISTGTDSVSNVTPKFSFMNIGEGMTIRGEFEIKGEVVGAKGVEYYLVQVGANMAKYIGTATALSETGWSLRFQSSGFPNGEFYLRATIKNIYGEYGSEQRRIFIANGNETTVSATSPNDGFTTLGMTTTEKIQVLQEFKQDIQMPTETIVATDVVSPDQERKQIFDYCQESPEKCFPERDSDKDGLSDVDEIRYGTDPHSADTDLDGFTDGDEVKNGFDPLKYSGGDKSDRIVFENPKVTGETKKEIYAVKNVEVKERQSGGKGLNLAGKGLPNSFVTIYIYSDPIVLTVKTDSDGNWTYELDKELENGEHQVYVAVTDNTGKITAKSEPLAFVKTAEAATVIPSVSAAQQPGAASVAQSRTQRDFFFLIAIVVAALAVALATIGLIKHRHAVTSEPTILQ